MVEYNRLRHQWLFELSRYSTKSVMLLNSRDTCETNLIEYIKERSPNLTDIIDILKTDEYLSIPHYDTLGYKKNKSV